MSVIVVEDGTGKNDATSYASVEEADNYFKAYGNKTWLGLSTGDKEVALNNGTRYLDQRYGIKIGGTLVAADQALVLPRNYLYDRYANVVTGIPVQWKKAVFEYALLSNQGTLYPEVKSNKGAIKSKKVKAGPVETTTEYQDDTFSGTFLEHPVADGYIKSLFSFVGSTSGAIRS